jgi:hypothetical protein
MPDVEDHLTYSLLIQDLPRPMRYVLVCLARTVAMRGAAHFGNASRRFSDSNAPGLRKCLGDKKLNLIYNPGGPFSPLAEDTGS